jgi:hypothetical protein
LEGGAPHLDRARVFDGEVLLHGASVQSSLLSCIAAEHTARAFGCAPDELPRLHERWSAEDSWAATCAARKSLACDPRAIAAALAVAESLGFERRTLALDAPRLRVVEPYMHRRPSAARAFYAHRDTWYGCPRAQVNVWIPLFDVDERDSFAIYPAAFGAPIDNDSAAFDYASFAGNGGFQSAGLITSTYPRATTVPPGTPLHVRALAQQVVVFSPAHLHATTPNETDHTRVSVDVRFVDLEEHACGVGADDVDNHSRGSALVDYAIVGAP